MANRKVVIAVVAIVAAFILIDLLGGMPSMIVSFFYPHRWDALQEIGTYQTEQVIRSLDEIMERGDETVLATIPQEVLLAPSSSVPFFVGVSKKRHPGGPGIFVLCIGKSADACTVLREDVTTTVTGDDSGIRFTAQNIITIPEEDGTGRADVSMEILRYARPGTHSFVIYACGIKNTAPEEAETCEKLENVYGSYEFEVTVR